MMWHEPATESDEQFDIDSQFFQSTFGDDYGNFLLQ